MTKLSLLTSLAMVSSVLATCTPSFTLDKTYKVTVSDAPSYGWHNNNTLGFLGVDLRVHLLVSPFPPQQPTQPSKPSRNPIRNSTQYTNCLYASKNSKVPGSGKIYSSLGCFDATGAFDITSSFEFTCTECSEEGGKGCSIYNPITKECAKTPVDDLNEPAGPDGTKQVVTWVCADTPYQRWDVLAA
ncbi:hypothetical protein NMY22_g18047 [Coprinellus aureogranulatus]|nr:hypothetical protein NMY22_g18047 [Coprinellus aureogranulatus]